MVGWTPVGVVSLGDARGEPGVWYRHTTREHSTGNEPFHDLDAGHDAFLSLLPAVVFADDWQKSCV